MIPYTLDAVQAIREAVRQSTPPQFIREKLGWDETMFERVCRKHGIDMPSQLPEQQSAIRTESKATIETPAVRQGYKHGHVTYTTVALSPTTIVKIDRYAARSGLGLSRGKTAAAIVDAQVAAFGTRGIEIYGRTPRGSGVGYDYLNIPLNEDTARLLIAEAKLRGTGASMAKLVKGLLMTFLESSS